MIDSNYPTFNVDKSYTKESDMYDDFFQEHEDKEKRNPLYINPYKDTKGVVAVNNHLLISGIFPTIQGEMPFAGHPAIFVRLAGCNRGSKVDKGCKYCDTNFEVKSSSLMTINQVADKIKDYTDNTGIRLVVITGGEPMLQILSLYALIKYVRATDWGHRLKFQFETNGDFHQNANVKYVLNELYNQGYALHNGLTIVCSPKSPKLLQNAKVLEDLPYYSTITNCKPHMVNIENFLSYRYLIATDKHFNGAYSDIQPVFKSKTHHNVYLSPITMYKSKPKSNEITKIEDDIDLEVTRENVALAIDIATKYGLKVSFQAHSYIGIA